MAKEKKIWNSTLKLNTGTITQEQNYIECASFYPKYEGSTGNLLNNGSDMPLSTRENTNSSLITLTSSDTRITFTQACSVFISVCNDVDYNSDSGYWYISFRKNGTIHTRQLNRLSTHWDQFAASDFIEFAANEYLTFRAESVSNIVGFNRDWGAWNVLCFVR